MRERSAYLVWVTCCTGSCFRTNAHISKIEIWAPDLRRPFDVGHPALDGLTSSFATRSNFPLAVILSVIDPNCDVELLVNPLSLYWLHIWWGADRMYLRMGSVFQGHEELERLLPTPNRDAERIALQLCLADQ